MVLRYFVLLFVGEKYDVKKLGREEAVLVGEVDSSYIQHVRGKYTFLKDRRPDLY